MVIVCMGSPNPVTNTWGAHQSSQELQQLVGQVCFMLMLVRWPLRNLKLHWKPSWLQIPNHWLMMLINIWAYIAIWDWQADSGMTVVNTT